MPRLPGSGSIGVARTMLSCRLLGRPDISAKSHTPMYSRVRIPQAHSMASMFWWEPLPRIWYSYAILHDAYIQGVPNREIMARLYISEGTFNRTRRNALRGLTRLLTEKQKRTLDATKS